MAVDQTISGTFVSAQGASLSNGTVVLQLSATAYAADGKRVVDGIAQTITLNSSGVISPSYGIYSNAGMTPNTTFYYITAYASDGTLAIPTTTVYIPASPNPVDISTLLGTS